MKTKKSKSKKEEKENSSSSSSSNDEQAYLSAQEVLEDVSFDNKKEGGVDDDDDPPRSVVSSSSEDEEEGTKPKSKDDDDKTDPTTPSVGTSIQFAPYRTLGVVSGSAPFHLVPNTNSATALVCCSNGDRFTLYKTEHLQPVLVSQTVPCVAKEKTKSSKKEKIAPSERRIDYCITDNLMMTTIVAHGDGSTPNRTDTVTFFRRTKALDSLLLASKSTWSIRGMIFMGRVKQPVKGGEKDGKMENTTILAVILSKTNDIVSDVSGNNDKKKITVNVPVVGEDEDASSSSSDSDSSSSEDSDSSEDSSASEEDSTSLGQVVILVATRHTIRIHNRVQLPFRPTVVMHPHTYLNKIVVGGHDNALCLVNIRSKKIIHNFTCLPKSSDGTKITITTLEQSPAVDTIAVGTNTGLVHLINLRHDKKLFSLRHKGRDSENGTVAITSISFRNDGSALQYGIAPVAVGRSDGTVTIWDLTPPEDDSMGRTILCEMQRVHPGGVSKLQYLPQEPLLLSTGTKSNAITMHIFDSPDHTGRLLRQRRGHTAPPCHIRYLNGGILANAADGTDPSKSCCILSTGGLDRTLRAFSTVRTSFDREYSQGKGLQKRAKKYNMEDVSELLLPPVTGIAMSDARSRDWGDLVTIHQQHSMAYVWSTKQGAQSGPVLRQDSWNVSIMKQAPPARTHATSVTMSACGNFALIGTKGGVIYKYNVQSGIPRGQYPTQDKIDDGKKGEFKAIGSVERTMKVLEKAMKLNNRQGNQDKEELDADLEAQREQKLQAKLFSASHTGYAVTGVAVDAINKTLISVGADAKLIFWHFKKNSPHKKCPYMLPSPATKMCLVRDSDLAAIALEDFTVVLFDCNALSIVRHFGKGSAKHAGAISDLAFSPDGRSLFTASMDSTIRVWDVPTNACSDWLGFKSPPTSMTVSPTGEFLATTHKGKLGICMWSDRSYYQTIDRTGANLSKPIPMDEPVPMGEIIEIERKEGAGNEKSSTGLKKEDEVDEKIPIIPKVEGLITLSGLPPAHWKNLFHLELVKERNKPKEAPKKPPSAPFFLQWRKGESMAEESKEDTRKVVDEDDAGEWAAAWSDDAEGEGELLVSENEPTKRELNVEEDEAPSKRRKVKHFRSHLASLLEQCSARIVPDGEKRYQEVSEHVASLGPSAIDVALSTLCNGMHDLEEGIPLLLMTCNWLQEACQSCERYEAVNAYLHRFLFLHATVIAGIEENGQNEIGAENEDQDKQHFREEKEMLLQSISELKLAQQKASETMRGKMEQTLCLLRHFSRMV